ncbi:hypothetical protein [Nocardia vinacea]|uniref:hypothetical protein n=1 Tax=Nocardia vinacea TaxID=96468 RepID=UPI0002E793C1|nr:hypothetical protein [Nocardia vinacea]
MHITRRAIAGVLAAVFLLSGAMKLFRTPEQLAASGLGWATDLGNILERELRKKYWARMRAR